MRERANKKFQIIFVDNYVIHFTIDVLKYCIENYILLIPLPKYSPDLNPIERLRRMLKRKVRAVYDDLNSLWEALQNTVKNSNYR